MHPETTAPPRPVLPIWAVLGPGVAALAGAFLLTTDLGPTGLAIQAELGAPRMVLLIGTGACLLAMAVGAPLGALALRAPIAVGVPAVAAMLIGLIAMGLAANWLNFFVVGRVLVGFGTGVVWAASALTARATGEQKRLATALLAGAVLVCLLLGPVVSGLIATVASWRVAYFAMIPVLLLALVAVVVSGIAVRRNR